MGMAQAAVRWTADMVRALPDDGKRYEVIDGELFVTPAPTLEHQSASRSMFRRLDAYASAHALGSVYYAPADIEFGAERMVEPDLFVLPLVAGRAPRTWEEVGRLLLVVEILSPGTARADRLVKRRLYQSEGVPEYWIVDVAARLVERWRPEDERPEILTEWLEWQPAADREALRVDLAAYFGEVVGPDP